jgi:hypothetical protein
VRESKKHSQYWTADEEVTEYAHAGAIRIYHRIGLVVGGNIILPARKRHLLLRCRMAGNETDVRGGNMSDAKQCAECEQIVTEMRAALLKLISARPRGDVLYVSRLFLSDADLARLKELWQQSGFGAAPA